MNRPAFHPGPLADVECRAAEDGWTLVFVRDLAHPPNTVWAALTEPEQLRAWAPYTTDRDLGSIGDAVLTMIDGESSEDLPTSVIRCEPPTLLEYTLGTDLLAWELSPTDVGTRLTLRHTLKDRDWVPKVAAGWHLCLVVAEHLLDGQPIPPIRGAEAKSYGWDELNEEYAERLAIPVSDGPGF
ncbi:MAG: SRPBCC family protein [Nocardioidaceae bacterium]